MSKVHIIIGMLLVSSMIGGGVYYYYTSTQTTIMQLTENNATLKSNQVELETAVVSANETITYLEDTATQIREQYAESQRQLNTIRQQNQGLRDRLSGHDISALAEAKPELVERIINNASANAMRCFELLSGAPLTDDERNAENGQKFNVECPWLFDTLVGP